MWRTWALGGALALGTFALAQRGAPDVNEAVTEIMATLPAMQCGQPEVWQVDGDVRGAAQFLLKTLRARGWSVMEQGATAHGYAVIVDPNPNDPQAVAIGGMLLGPTNGRAKSTAFLARCTLSPQDDGEGWFTALPPRPGAL